MVRDIVLLLVLAFPQLSLATQTLCVDPFQGVNLDKVGTPTSKTLKEAREDFILVQKGLTPKFAKFDEDAPLPADGGTTYYIGHNYKLIISKSLSVLGEEKGYIYGPIITFSKDFAPGNMNVVSALRFYTVDRLKILLEHANKASQGDR